MEFITKYSESVKKGTFQHFYKPSMTEPDNAMSIPEIIARFTRGQGIVVNQHPWDVGTVDNEPTELDEFMGEAKQEPAQAQPDPAPANVSAPAPAPAGA